jgi:hypothetical protein
VNVVPTDVWNDLRGFTQEHHRALWCGPRPSEDLNASSIHPPRNRVVEIRREVEEIALVRAGDLRHIAALLEGLRALGSGRVLDEVLALVLNSAIDVTGAERGFIMLANKSGQLEFKLARAKAG